MYKYNSLVLGVRAQVFLIHSSIKTACRLLLSVAGAVSKKTDQVFNVLAFLP